MANKHSSKDRKKHKREKLKKQKKEKKYKKHKKQKQKFKSDSDSSESEASLKEVKKDSSKAIEWGFFDEVLKDSNVSVKNMKEQIKRPSPERPGQNIRELNPYWKDGGCGLPPIGKEKFKNEESTSDYNFLSSTSSHKDSCDRSKTELGRDNKQINKSNFLKPGEDLNFNLNRTFQRNWKKKELKKPEEVKMESEAHYKDEKTSNPSESSYEDLNKLASKLVKAEIMGNIDLVNKLKAELETAKKAKEETLKEESKKKRTEIVIMTDRVMKTSYDNKQSSVPLKKQKISTHDSTGRVHFLNDDKYSLKNLFQKEKGVSEEEILLPMKLIGKNPDELDDIYLEAAASNKMQQKIEERKNRKAKKEAVVKYKSLEGCHWCLDNRNKTKHLIVSIGNKCYLCLPEEESLNKGHCIIVPLQHEISTLHLDEDVWNEIKTYQRVLSEMFLQQAQDVVFFENARTFKNFPHCFIQCVPLDKKMGDVAPVYFKKALLESETEWCNNKKVIDFRKKDLRQSIPKDLPYFAISFGTEGGFAHIIEDEYLFKRNFAEEVLGGMLDLEHRKWRKPQKENFRTQREKALDFLKMWKKFEFNENSFNSDSSSSE